MTRQGFTDAARAAGATARKKRQALRMANPVEVFVVRDGIHYGWEIRKFGAVLIEKAVETFDTSIKARVAGTGALRALALAASEQDAAPKPPLGVSKINSSYAAVLSSKIRSPAVTGSAARQNSQA